MPSDVATRASRSSNTASAEPVTMAASSTQQLEASAGARHADRRAERHREVAPADTGGPNQDLGERERVSRPARALKSAATILCRRRSQPRGDRFPLQVRSGAPPVLDLRVPHHPTYRLRRSHGARGPSARRGPLPQELIERLAPANHLGRVQVFGSVARGLDTPASDIDFLVAPNDDASLFDLAQFESDLEALFDREVDVVSRCALDTELLASAVDL